ncbi:hypothetical protein BAOM_1063 [Peribacillus asahii]|uniref:Uncharacterized protein n=1 Tax=Peribacillus asahii TaxID=228899 RepID=A0A3T0KN14_9BACI|nr:hypothetical protein BAOM_1063 [Peribacillus asahii]
MNAVEMNEYVSIYSPVCFCCYKGFQGDGIVTKEAWVE